MIALALAAALQASTMPQAPPARIAPPPTARAAPNLPVPSRRSVAGLKAMGLSDAGLRILQTTGGADPDAKAFADRRAALHARVGMLAGAQPFDPAAFIAALKDENGVEGEARGRMIDRITRTLQQLSPADQPIFARAVLGRRGASMAPVAPPPPPPAAPVPPK